MGQSRRVGVRRGGLVQGDARQLPLADDTVQCVITSPPYWGLRDYGTASWVGGDPACRHQQGRPGAGRADGIVDDRMQRNRDGVGAMGGDCRRCGARRVDSQLGLEPTPDRYVRRLVRVFREVRRVLRDDGVVFLNLGDSYARTGGVDTISPPTAQAGNTRRAHELRTAERKAHTGLKDKDLVGIPWRVAFALQADGWYLRADIIWHKPNPMPESVRDRPTRAHEYVFLLTKNARYYYDADAVREPHAEMTRPQSARRRAQRMGREVSSVGDRGQSSKGIDSGEVAASHVMQTNPAGRNRRSVWTIPTQPYRGAHFATFPEALVTPCLLAGSARYHDDRARSVVLDPFCGSGTVGLVAARHRRVFVGLDLKRDYLQLAQTRLG